MAKVRMINTRFWEDGFIETLSVPQKLLFLWCLTNYHTNLCGIYECSLTRISFESGIPEKDIKEGFIKFAGKIHYIPLGVSGWIFVRNYPKYQSYKSDTTKNSMEAERKGIPFLVQQAILKVLEDYPEGNQTGMLFPVEPKVEKKQKSFDEDIKIVFEHYRTKIKQDTRLTKVTKDKIKTRLGEYSVEELKNAIDNFANDDWRMEHNSNYGMKWFFSSEDQVAKWLQLKPVVNNSGSIKVS